MKDKKSKPGEYNSDNLPPESEKKSTKPQPKKGPFVKAESLPKRLKLFIWGDSGVGKTPLALQFPSPAVIDTERGTDRYGTDIDFHVVKTIDPVEIMNTVDWLMTNEHEFKTIIVDSITIYWQALQKRWSDIFLAREKGSKQFKHEYFDMQPGNWNQPKSEHRELIRKLTVIDMNVIVIARQKTNYKEGTFMVVDGVTFDGEKTLPYSFDTHIKMYVDGGKNMGLCFRDRARKFKKGDIFECSFDKFNELFGESLDLKATPVNLITDMQKATIKGLIQKLKLDNATVKSSLIKYNALEIEDLRESDAEIVIDKLTLADKAATK